jgi:hypothetical protein
VYVRVTIEMRDISMYLSSGLLREDSQGQWLRKREFISDSAILIEGINSKVRWRVIECSLIMIKVWIQYATNTANQLKATNN